MFIRKLAIGTVFITLFTSGCARNIDSDVYTSSNLTGTVVEGTIVSTRQVRIKEKDSLGKNTYGGIAGAALFGTAGSAVGGGTGSQIASIASGIVGSLVGAKVEDKLGNSTGIEYIVKLDGNNQIDNRIYDSSYNDNYYNLYNNNYRRNNNYRNNFNGDTIFVIQRDTTPLHINQRVLVIYERGKARIIAKG